MFTGIVEELGRVRKISPRAGMVILEIDAQKALLDTKIGDSIAVNGVCLTAVAVKGTFFGFEVMQQTFKNTNLGLISIGQLVNLERSLKVGDRVGGHFVSGHIDCLGLVRRKTIRNGSLELAISVPPAFIPYCLPKGSISVDGISLTLASIRANIFTVCIIPHTLKNTTLSLAAASDKLNIEFDILAKRAAV